MSSTTAEVMITDALKEIGVVGEGETPSAMMMADGLRMINRLLDTLSIDAAFDHESTLHSLALTGQTSFDVGPTGDIVTQRPIKITSAYVTQGGIDYPVRIVSIEEYDSIPMKASTGAITECIAYNGVYPDGVVYLYPICSGCTIHFRTAELVKNFATTATTIDLPEGYEDAIMLALSVRMAPSYGVKVSPETRQAAKNAMHIVKRNNRVIPKLDIPAPLAKSAWSGLAAIFRG
jgi:hypothetical protein